jgi:ubiquitin C-terminal hydrolase
MVEYQDESDMSPFGPRRMGVTKCGLVAVIQHSGELGRGHYHADVLHDELGK